MNQVEGTKSRLCAADSTCRGASGGRNGKKATEAEMSL